MSNNIAIFDNDNRLLGLIQTSNLILLNLRFLYLRCNLHTCRFEDYSMTDKIDNKYFFILSNNKIRRDYDINCTNKKLVEKLVEKMRENPIW